MNFYRYEIRTYASLSSDGDFIKSVIPNPKVEVTVFNLLKETDKGYWIGYGYLTGSHLRSQGRWVSKTAKKRYAYPTKIEALDNFIKRTERRASILSSKLLICQISIKIAKNIGI